MAGRPTCSSALDRLLAIVHDLALGAFEPDPGHGVAEQQAVLGLVDRLGVGADQLDLVLLEPAVAMQRHRRVERGLAAHRRQDGVRPLLLDDLGHHVGRDRLDVGRVGQARIGHDRGRVGVHQDDAIALVLQRLAGLHAGIVELAGLADHDRTGADDQDALDVACAWACGHSTCPCSCRSSRRSGRRGSGCRSGRARPRDGTAPRRPACRCSAGPRCCRRTARRASPRRSWAAIWR